MAVVGIAVERPGSPEATFECGKHVITRKFRVLTSTVLDGPIAVANAIGIPRLFMPYQFGAEFHPYCRVRSIEPERMAPASLDWVVTVRYETPEMKDGATADGGHDSDANDGGGTGEEKDQQFENPLAAIPEIETHWETTQIPIQGISGFGLPVTVSNGSNTFTYGPGYNGWINAGDICQVEQYSTVPIPPYNGLTQKKLTTLLTAVTSVNPTTGLVMLNDSWAGTSGAATFIDLSVKALRSSAGEVFVPPPRMDDSMLVMTITRNENINSPIFNLSASLMNTVNSDPWFSFQPGQVKIQTIKCQRQNKQLPDGTVFPYLRVTYLFHIKSSWDIQLLDKGSYYKYRSSMMNPWEPVKFRTDNGQPRDGCLDGTGQVLADGAAPVYIWCRPYNRIAFAGLNLPQAFNQCQ